MRPPIWTFLGCRAFCHFRAERRSFSRVRRSRPGRSSRHTRPCTGGIHAWSPGHLAEQEESVEGVTVVSGMRSAGQSRRCRGASVGRRSSVSSSSARWASSASDHPRARAMQSATCQDGLALPASISRSLRTLIPAASASASCFRSSSSRRRPIARPPAACGVGLRGTPEASGYSALVTRNYSSGMLTGYALYRGVRLAGTRDVDEVRGVSEGSGLRSQRGVQRLAATRLDRLGECDEFRQAPSQRAGDPVDGAVGQVRTSVLDVRDPALILTELEPKGLLGHFEFFAAQADRAAERDLRFLGGVGRPRNPRCSACSWLWNGFHINVSGSAARPCARRWIASTVAVRRYSMSRNRSAGVVPRARASRSRVWVVASACAFSSSLRNDKSTPLRWASLTCEIPVASRDARRLRAS